MTNLMINIPGTRHSPLTTKTKVYVAQVLAPLDVLEHPPFLTSETPAAQNTQSVEQELAQYMLETYPKISKHW